MAGRFVTLHGIDAVGKTTITQRVAEHLNRNGTTTFDWQSFTREAGMGELLSNRGDFAASLAKKALEGDKVAQFLERELTIVKDRWVIDVMASHAFDGLQMDRVEGGALSRLLTPDFSVVAVCDEDERMARVRHRVNPTPEDLVPRVPGTRAYFFQDFLLENIGRFARRSMVLDTTGKNADQAANLIIERMKDDVEGV